jgi:hypothetical protein
MSQPEDTDQQYVSRKSECEPHSSGVVRPISNACADADGQRHISTLAGEQTPIKEASMDTNETRCCATADLTLSVLRTNDYSTHCIVRSTPCGLKGQDHCVQSDAAVSGGTARSEGAFTANGMLSSRGDSVRVENGCGTETDSVDTKSRKPYTISPVGPGPTEGQSIEEGVSFATNKQQQQSDELLSFRGTVYAKRNSRKRMYGAKLTGPAIKASPARDCPGMSVPCAPE